MMSPSVVLLLSLSVWTVVRMSVPVRNSPNVWRRSGDVDGDGAGGVVRVGRAGLVRGLGQRTKDQVVAIVGGIHLKVGSGVS